MQTGERVSATPPRKVRSARGSTASSQDAITGGGPEGNEQLTATTGVVLIVLLAVIGVTILRIGQLINIHLFVGLLLIGPVALKMASTGYRFLRYYTNDAVYLEKGPPQPMLRLIAPFVVLTTVGVFASGVILMFEGPTHRDPWLLLHKATFIGWGLVTALHVLGHLPGMPRALRAVDHARPRGMTGAAPGSAGRWISLIGALVGGVVLAIVLIPHFGIWSNGGFQHVDGGR